MYKRQEPEQVVEMLNYYFDNVTMAVLEEGGTIDKFIGDAIMVQFGAPKEFEDHADRAIRAALKIKEIAELYKEVLPELFPDKDLPTFNIGIGINTGSAIIGNMGSSTNMGYTAIGDVTNSTARIESKTKELHCTILASKRTLELSHLNIKTGLHENVHVKGKDKPIDVFEIIDINPD